MSESATGWSDEHGKLLAHVLDGIIPPSADGRLPGAGALGLASEIGPTIGASEEQRGLLEAALDALDALARERLGAGYAALAPEDRSEVLTAYAEANPVFVPGLMFPVYVAYYQHPQVLEALGLEPRPPYPKGYEIEPSNLSDLLEGVRSREQFYRKA